MKYINYYTIIFINLVVLMMGGCAKDYADYYSDYDTYDDYYSEQEYLYNNYPSYLNDGRYRSYGKLYTNCDKAGYRCKTIKKGESWSSLYPDKEKRKLIKAINRTNTPLQPGKTIQEPNDNYGLNNKDFSPLPSQDYR